MYQQLINIELKTDINGAIRGYGKASLDNLQNKVQIPLIEDLFPCFMCNLCNNILNINIFVSLQQQQPSYHQANQTIVIPANVFTTTPVMQTVPQVVNVVPSESYVLMNNASNNNNNNINGVRVEAEVNEGGETESSDESEESEEEEEDEDDEEEDDEDEEEEEEEEDDDEGIDNISNDNQDVEDATNDASATTTTTNATKLPFTCLTCESKFRTKTSLYYHYRASATCPKPDERRRYKRSHTEITSENENAENGYKCDTCDRIYTTRFARYYHYKKGECSRPKMERQRAPYVCNICCKILTTRRGYIFHHRNHEIKENKKPKEKQTFQCPKCNKIFKSKLGFKQHQDLHLDDMNRVYQCDKCARGFGSKIGLAMHKLSHKRNQNKFTCTICDKSYDDNGMLQQHLVEHSKQLKVPISQCDCPQGQTFILDPN